MHIEKHPDRTIRAPDSFKFMGKTPNEMSRSELLRAMDAFAELNALYRYEEFCTYKNGEKLNQKRAANAY